MIFLKTGDLELVEIQRFIVERNLVSTIDFSRQAFERAICFFLKGFIKRFTSFFFFPDFKKKKKKPQKYITHCPLPGSGTSATNRLKKDKCAEKNLGKKTFLYF